MPEDQVPYTTPTCSRAEDLPAYPWDALLMRLRHVGQQHVVGTHVVMIWVMMQDGRPVLWLRPEVIGVEPKASGPQVLELLRKSIDGADHS